MLGAGLKRQKQLPGAVASSTEGTARAGRGSDHHRLYSEALLRFLLSTPMVLNSPSPCLLLQGQVAWLTRFACLVSLVFSWNVSHAASNCVLSLITACHSSFILIASQPNPRLSQPAEAASRVAGR